jgi:hypothetical protein
MQGRSGAAAGPIPIRVDLISACTRTFSTVIPPARGALARRRRCGSAPSRRGPEPAGPSGGGGPELRSRSGSRPGLRRCRAGCSHLPPRVMSPLAEARHGRRPDGFEALPAPAQARTRGRPKAKASRAGRRVSARFFGDPAPSLDICGARSAGARPTPRPALPSRGERPAASHSLGPKPAARTKARAGSPTHGWPSQGRDTTSPVSVLQNARARRTLRRKRPSRARRPPAGIGPCHPGSSGWPSPPPPPSP